MQSNLTVMGLYNYDPTLFANMEFPTGFTTQEADNLINSIIMETAELEVLYSSPVFMKTIIGVWSKKELPTWNRVYAAAQAEYNPIENYDRQETSSDTSTASRQHSGTDTTTNTGTDTVTNSGKDTTQFSGTDTSSTTVDNDVSRGGTDATRYSGSDVTTNRVAGFDSNTLVNKEDSTTAYGKVESITHGETIATDETVTGSLTHGQKSELTHGHVEATQHGLTQAMQHGEKIEDSTSNSHTSRIHGNIGVTTSQQMLEQELEVAPKLNITNYIVDSFKKRFCLLVY